MAFELYAHVAVPTFSTDKQGAPQTVHPRTTYKRVLVQTYATKLLAQWWGINVKRIYIDEAKTLLVTERQVILYEIVEVP